MTGIVTSRTARADVQFSSEYIYKFTLSFVAPLCAKDHCDCIDFARQDPSDFDRSYAIVVELDR